MREAERKLMRDLADLRARQLAAEVVLIQFVTGLLRNFPDVSAVLEILRRGPKFTVECADKADAEIFRLMVEEHFERIADGLQEAIGHARTVDGR